MVKLFKKIAVISFSAILLFPLLGAENSHQCFLSGGVKYKFQTAYEKLGYAVSLQSPHPKEMVLTAVKGDMTLTVRYAVLGHDLKMTSRVKLGSYASAETGIIPNWNAEKACCIPVPMPLDREVSLNIYPKLPVTEAYISLYNTTAPIAQVQIFNSDGKPVLNTALETWGLLQWDTANLPGGKYLVRVRVNGKSRYTWAMVSRLKPALAKY